MNENLNNKVEKYKYITSPMVSLVKFEVIRNATKAKQHYRFVITLMCFAILLRTKPVANHCQGFWGGQWDLNTLHPASVMMSMLRASKTRFAFFCTVLLFMTEKVPKLGVYSDDLEAVWGWPVKEQIGHLLLDFIGRSIMGSLKGQFFGLVYSRSLNPGHEPLLDRLCLIFVNIFSLALHPDLMGVYYKTVWYIKTYVM